MARGFFLSDALFNERWTGVSIVNGTGAYNNAASEADRVLAASPFALWSSVEVTAGQGARTFDIQFARDSTRVLADSVCVFGIQVLGRLQTVSEVDVRSSLAAPRPRMTIGTKIPTTASKAVPLEAWGYEQPPATIGERPKVIVTWRGNMYLPINPTGGRIGSGFRVAFSADVGNTHSIRVARIVFGQRTTWGQNPRPNWTLTRTSPTAFDRIPGQYSGGLVRTPSYRTIQAEISNIDNAHMKALNDMYHLHGSGQYAVPLVLCVDPDNLDTLVYGRFIDWSDTFNIKTGTTGDRHSLRFTFEEVNS